MSFADMHHIGAHLNTVLGTLPAEYSGTTAVTGAAIDHTGFLSCQIAVLTAAATGTPDSFSLTLTVEDSPDGSGSWAAYKPDGVTAASVVAATGSATKLLDLDLQHSRGYIRTVVTPAFVNGTTPKILAATAVVLGGAHTLPAHS